MEEKDRLQMIIDRAARFLKSADNAAAEVMKTAHLSERLKIGDKREFIAHVLKLLEVDR